MKTYRFEYAVMGARRKLHWFEKMIPARNESSARKIFGKLRGYHSHTYCADGCCAGPFVTVAA